MKKLTSVLLALVLALTLCSTAWAASATTDVTYYDPVTGSSVTRNAKVLGNLNQGRVLHSGNYYVVNDTVVIKGNLKFNGDVYLILMDNASLTVKGIHTNAENGAAPNLTIYSQRQNGAGKLTVNGYVDNDYGCGVDLTKQGSLTVNGGNIIVTGGNGNGAPSYAVYVNKLTVNGGKLTVNGGSSEIGSVGINTYCDYNDNGEPIARGVFTVNGGEVTAVGGNGGSSYGIYVDGNADISGTVTANGGQGEDESYGICVDGTVTISGGNVTATGADCNTDGEYAISTGFYALGLTVSNGTLNATGGAASGKVGAWSYGVYTAGDIEVTGGAINADGDTADCGGDASSYGVCAGGSITVTDGTINAAGKAVTSNGNRIVDTEDRDVNYGGAWSYGVFAKTVAVQNSGKIDGAGGVATCRGENDGCVAWSCGVYSEKDFTVGSSGTVTGTSGGANGCGNREKTNVCSFGVYSDEGITVNDSGKISGTSGNVTAHSTVEVYCEGVCAKGDITAGANAVTSVDGEVTIHSHRYVKSDASTADTADAPKTFDAGAGIYAVTALLSYTGTALVIRGRKRK